MGQPSSKPEVEAKNAAILEEILQLLEALEIDDQPNMSIKLNNNKFLTLNTKQLLVKKNKVDNFLEKIKPVQEKLKSDKIFPHQHTLQKKLDDIKYSFFTVVSEINTKIKYTDVYEKISSLENKVHAAEVDYEQRLELLEQIMNIDEVYIKFPDEENEYDVQGWQHCKITDKNRENATFHIIASSQKEDKSMILQNSSAIMNYKCPKAMAKFDEPQNEYSAISITTAAREITSNCKAIKDKLSPGHAVKYSDAEEIIKCYNEMETYREKETLETAQNVKKSCFRAELKNTAAYQRAVKLIKEHEECVKALKTFDKSETKKTAKKAISKCAKIDQNTLDDNNKNILKDAKQFNRKCMKTAKLFQDERASDSKHKVKEYARILTYECYYLDRIKRSLNVAKKITKCAEALEDFQYAIRPSEADEETVLSSCENLKNELHSKDYDTIEKILGKKNILELLEVDEETRREIQNKNREQQFDQLAEIFVKEGQRRVEILKTTMKSRVSLAKGKELLQKHELEDNIFQKKLLHTIEQESQTSSKWECTLSDKISDVWIKLESVEAEFEQYRKKRAKILQQLEIQKVKEIKVELPKLNLLFYKSTEWKNCTIKNIHTNQGKLDVICDDKEFTVYPDQEFYYEDRSIALKQDSIKETANDTISKLESITYTKEETENKSFLRSTHELKKYTYVHTKQLQPIPLFYDLTDNVNYLVHEKISYESSTENIPGFIVIMLMIGLLIYHLSKIVNIKIYYKNKLQIRTPKEGTKKKTN